MDPWVLSMWILSSDLISSSFPSNLKLQLEQFTCAILSPFQVSCHASAYNDMSLDDNDFISSESN